MRKPISTEQLLLHVQNMIPLLAQLNEEDWGMIVPLLKVVKLKKGTYFIKDGQVCHQIGFLYQGILRVFHLVNGKEFSSYFNFASRNPIVSAFESFLLQSPSSENIHALEDSVVITITFAQLQSLYEQSPRIQKLGRLMAEQNYLLAMERIKSLQFHSATDRYSALLKIYPQLINKIPHHYVASYLGVTPESLSRIRKSFE